MSSEKPSQKDASNQDGTNNDELTAVVEELLDSLSNKFQGVSKELFAKMDEMSKRIDNLEAELKASQDKDAGSPSRPS